MTIYFSELLLQVQEKKTVTKERATKAVTTKTPKIDAKPRLAQTGENVNLPAAVELRKINEEIRLHAREFVSELNAFNGTLLSRELYQSYLQGYIKSTESYEKLLELVQPFLVRRRELYGPLMSGDMVSIINKWYKALSISADGLNGSPSRLLSERLGEQVNPLRPRARPKKIDPTTIFRWLQSNKKPSSITTLIWLDELVKKSSS
jgi:hypothetical protein